MFTARGTLPPYHSLVLSPKETACEKLSCPRKIPDSRAIQISKTKALPEPQSLMTSTYIAQRYYLSLWKSDNTSNFAKLVVRTLSHEWLDVENSMVAKNHSHPKV